MYLLLIAIAALLAGILIGGFIQCIYDKKLIAELNEQHKGLVDKYIALNTTLRDQVSSARVGEGKSYAALEDCLKENEILRTGLEAIGSLYETNGLVWETLCKCSRVKR